MHGFRQQRSPDLRLSRSRRLPALFTATQTKWDAKEEWKRMVSRCKPPSQANWCSEDIVSPSIGSEVLIAERDRWRRWRSTDKGRKRNVLWTNNITWWRWDTCFALRTVITIIVFLLQWIYTQKPNIILLPKTLKCHSVLIIYAAPRYIYIYINMVTTKRNIRFLRLTLKMFVK